jgi:4'-phosphopantetheinyl transferase EntD
VSVRTLALADVALPGARLWLVITAITDTDDDVTALHPAEQARAQAFGPKRRRTFVAGRRALRACLSAAGLACTDAIGATDRGAPLLPEALPSSASVRVSISHKDTVAAACVWLPPRDMALAAALPHMGVDVEELGDAARRSARDIASHVLTERERAQLPQGQATAAQRQRAVLLRFSAKEALYKAIDPVVRRYVGFLEVEVEAARDVPAHDIGAPSGWPAAAAPLGVSAPLAEGTFRAGGLAIVGDTALLGSSERLLTVVWAWPPAQAMDPSPVPGG